MGRQAGQSWARYRPFPCNTELCNSLRNRPCWQAAAKMPTRCCVVKCHNRHTKVSNRSFYGFPKDPNRQRQWLAFYSWEPGDGDCVCSDHFLSGRKSESPGSPDYVPSVYPHQGLKAGTDGIVPKVSRFERTQQRARGAVIIEINCSRKNDNGYYIYSKLLTMIMVRCLRMTCVFLGSVRKHHQ